ncbi:MAG: Gfo/Idh/MocA family oxidoreductase [Ruminococcaceae bacterium]|nr:Gfo/Idh/MocA family oxidoreductase [Oscillospiraceae bacterium]
MVYFGGIMSKTYKVMLIGCGHIGLEHLQDIYYRDNVIVEAVVDLNEEAAKSTARRYGSRNWGTDYKRFLGPDGAEIVIIATYVNSHLSILKDCLEAGKHVLCEKPITSNLEEGREFLRLVKSYPQKVLIAHILRHNNSYQKIKELMDCGVIGDIRLMRMTQNHHAMNWKRYCRLMEDCSPTVDCGVHYYDVAQWLTGANITSVTGFGTKTQFDAPRDNYTMVNFTMDNGCKGFYEAGWGQTIRAANLKEFIGTRGRITLEMALYRSGDSEEGDLITIYHSDTGVYESVNVKTEYKNMYAQLQTLIDMIENDTEGNPTIDEAWRAFAVALAADEAIKTNTTVDIDEFGK